MPAETTSAAASKPPAARPTRTTAKKTARPPAKPKPAAPPAQATQSARPAQPPQARRRPTKAAPTQARSGHPAPDGCRAAEPGHPGHAGRAYDRDGPPGGGTAAGRRAAARRQAGREADREGQAGQAARPPKPTRDEKRAAKVAAAPRPGRRARLRLTRIDPWSVMKTSFLLSIALGIVIVVSVLMVWSVLSAADVWSSINKTVQDVVGGQDASNFDIEDYLGTRRVVGFTMIVAVVDVVLLTAICTLGAFLYNMSASLLGGIEVTLAEDH